MSRFKVIPELDNPYFVTCTIVEWLPVFIAGPYFEIITQSLQYCREHKGLRLFAYVIMPTHLHLIAGTEGNHSLSDVMRDFKRYTSRAISGQLAQDRNKLFLGVFARAARTAKGNTKYKVWQDGFHPELIYSKPFFVQKLDYLHANPVRKGLVAAPQDWLYSSARNYYLHDHSVMELDLIEF